jgi:GNAT superfamily N-acetyltransferase
MRAIDLTEAAILDLHDELFEARIAKPLKLGGREERTWADCELAALAENRLGDMTDPRGIDEAQRTRWKHTATTEPEFLPQLREYERCCWLLHGDERVGTIALANSSIDHCSMTISSLYVFPTHRGRGLGRGALKRIADILEQHSLMLRLNTSWTWQRTVRGYLRMGMWARMWRRDLEFRMRSSDPTPVVEFTADEAMLSVIVAGRKTLLIRAKHRGDWLELEEPDSLDLPRAGELAWAGRSTMALELAMRGWPLIRSPEDWEERRHLDGGAPESLAARIETWEAWDRAHGWKVETPRIARLEYPSWDDLQTRWRRELQALSKL